jgi:hypothetical protein
MQTIQERFGAKSAALLDKRVGFVRITKPVEYTQHYEVACWYTKFLSDVGDFDVILRKPWDIRPYEPLVVNAVVPATVTQCYTPSLFGGVVMGAGNGDKEVGRRDTIPVMQSFADAVARKAHTISGVEFIIDRDFIEAAEEYVEVRLREDLAKMPGYTEAYLASPRSRFNSEISMVAHVGREIASWGKLLEEILRQKEYRFGDFAQYEKVQGRPDPQAA